MFEPRSALLATAIAAGIAGIASGEDTPATTAFVDVTVVPMDSERALPHHTVLVAGARIVAVGPVDEVDVPADARRIDGANRYLMPGLADMHVHTFDEADLTLFLANGVTTVRNMWGMDLHLQWRDAIASGSMLGPTIHTAGPLLDGTPPIWPGSTVLETPEEAVAEVRRQKDAGYEFVKVYNRLRPEVYDAIVATAAEVGMPVIGHVPDAVGMDRVLAAKQHTIEHLTGWIGATQGPASPFREERSFRRRMLGIPFIDDDLVAALALRTKAAGTWNCVTLVVMDRFAYMHEPERFASRPEMKYVSPGTKLSWQPQNDFRAAGMTDEYIAALREGETARRRFTKALHDAGAGILLGTDTPNPWVVPGFAIHEELANLVSAGLTPYESLRAGTVDAATALGQAGVFGTVTPGARADLLLLDGDPLADVANVRRRAGVMVRGRWLAAEDLDTRLETLAARYESLARDADRFATCPALPDEGRREHFARFEIRAGTMTLGEERYAVQRLEDGSRLVASQATYMPFTSVNDIRARVDEDGRVQRMDIALPNGTVAVVRDDTGFRVTGTVDGAEIDEHHELPAGARLTAQSWGLEAFHDRNYVQLEDDGTLEVASRSINYWPSFSVQAGTATVRSAGGLEPVSWLGTKTFVRTFTSETEGMPGAMKVQFDPSGRLHRAELPSQMGTMIVERVE